MHMIISNYHVLTFYLPLSSYIQSSYPVHHDKRVDRTIQNDISKSRRSIYLITGNVIFFQFIKANTIQEFEIPWAELSFKSRRHDYDSFHQMTLRFIYLISRASDILYHCHFIDMGYIFHELEGNIQRFLGTNSFICALFAISYNNQSLCSYKNISQKHCFQGLHQCKLLNYKYIQIKNLIN